MNPVRQQCIPEIRRVNAGENNLKTLFPGIAGPGDKPVLAPAALENLEAGNGLCVLCGHQPTDSSDGGRALDGQDSQVLTFHDSTAERLRLA